MTKSRYIIYLLLTFCALPLYFCDFQNKETETPKVKKEALIYFNHADSARYVGMNVCRQCHENIYKTFIRTGMGRSFDLATREKTSASFENAYVYDKNGDFHYRAYWKNDSLYFHEYRLEKKDTVHSRTEQVNYIIGSGQHTNSHLQNVNGYFNQMPMTYYTQKKHWDLPPGFENGFNTHFTRKIGLECMSCHNALPDFVQGSENKFISVPSGIDCERCHGPGSIHVSLRQTTERIDTSKYIDSSIVNPAKLPVDLQFDICQRCHLQGNAVLKEGKSFYDFKPGKKLSDYISVFLPKYKGADEEFIMASHADRLKQSPCFIKSSEKIKNKKALRPYKEAMACVTCHNPHVSVRETNKNVFNDACLNCHLTKESKKGKGGQMSVLIQSHSKLSLSNISDCVGCHMPVSGSTDIPHVTVHDHYIRKPVSKKEQEKIKTFVGLFSVNEKNPDALTRAKAYINQYDKFEQESRYLDSAQKLLSYNNRKDLEKNFRSLIRVHFIRQDFKKILFFVNKYGEEKTDSLLSSKSYDNADAWACYHIAEANYYTGNIQNSVKWLKRAVKLAPYNLDFHNKLAGALAVNNMNEAASEYEYILKENPKYVAAYSNLGFIRLKQGFPQEAIRLYNFGIQLDPDNEPLLLNLAGYYAFNKNKKQATYYLERILKKNPGNQKAKMALQQVKTML